MDDSRSRAETVGDVPGSFYRDKKEGSAQEKKRGSSRGADQRPPVAKVGTM